MVGILVAGTTVAAIDVTITVIITAIITVTIAVIMLIPVQRKKEDVIARVLEMAVMIHAVINTIIITMAIRIANIIR